MMLKGLTGAGVLISGALLFFLYSNFDTDNGRIAKPSISALGSPNASTAVLSPSAPTPVAGLSAPSSQHREKQTTPPLSITKTLTLRLGDTLSRLLGNAGISPAVAQDVIGALKPLYDPRKIQAGQSVMLTLKPARPGDATKHAQPAGKAAKPNYTLSALTMPLDYTQKVEIKRGPNGMFKAKTLKRRLLRKVIGVEAPINSSLFLAGKGAGVPVTVMNEMVHVYSWDVDFQRDIRQGDTFQVMYQQLTDKNGTTVHTGNIVYAQLTLRGLAKKIYRYSESNGTSDYFDENGQSARKALMRTPIDGARLSSGFGKRRHPILGYTKMHKGTDFAAPRGTPIYAAGNGTLTYIGRNGGYGNYIRIRHNRTYSTAYGHMSRFAKGMYKGRRVTQGQIIGYVGSTGRSTGPHLHFEVLYDGRQVNPMTVKMPSGKKLHGKELKRFLAVRNQIRQQWAALNVSGQTLAKR